MSARSPTLLCRQEANASSAALITPLTSLGSRDSQLSMSSSVEGFWVRYILVDASIVVTAVVQNGETVTSHRSAG